MKPDTYDPCKCQDVAAAAAGRWSNALEVQARRKAVQRSVQDAENQVSPRCCKISTHDRDVRGHHACKRSVGPCQDLPNAAYFGRKCQAIRGDCSLVRKVCPPCGGEEGCEEGARGSRSQDKVPSQLWDALQNYKRLRTLHFESAQPDLSKDDAKFFLTISMQPLTASAENQGINSFWNTTCPDAPNILATKLRMGQ